MSFFSPLAALGCGLLRAALGRTPARKAAAAAGHREAARGAVAQRAGEQRLLVLRDQLRLLETSLIHVQLLLERLPAAGADSGTPRADRERAA